MRYLFPAFFCAIYLWAHPLFSQRDTSHAFGFYIYANYYLPSSTTANYYNGKDNRRLETLLANPQIRNRIELALGGFEFELLEYANDMQYNNAFAFELELDYRFGNNWKASVHFINAQVEAVGNFTLRVNRVNRNNQTNDPYIEKVTAAGAETRSHINLGLGKIFPLGDGFVLNTEAGFNVNFVEVNSNRIIVRESDFSLPLYNNQFNQQIQEITTIGSGFYLTTGIGYEMTNGYGFQFKLNYINTNIDVNEVVSENSNIYILGIGLSKAW